MIKKILLATIAGLLCGAAAAHATTITFDDIGVPSGVVGTPGFTDQGYNFGGGASDVDISSTSPWSNEGPAYSGHYAALSNYSNVITMSQVGGKAFSLQDFFEKDWVNGNFASATVTGYLSGQVVGSLQSTDTDIWTDIAVNFADVDTVTFSSGGYAFLLDNVTVNAAAAVPEPASMALLGAGIVSLGMIRRRKAA